MFSKVSRINKGAYILLPISFILRSKYGNDQEVICEAPNAISSSIPSRENCLNKLKSGEKFDILIIGGGATGAGAGKY